MPPAMMLLKPADKPDSMAGHWNQIPILVAAKAEAANPSTWATGHLSAAERRRSPTIVNSSHCGFRLRFPGARPRRELARVGWPAGGSARYLAAPRVYVSRPLRPPC